MFKTIAVLISSLSLAAVFGLQTNDPVHERAQRLHSSSLLVDGHNDLPWKLRDLKDMQLTKFDLTKEQDPEVFHTDIPRLQKGGMVAQFWSAYVPSATMDTGNSYSMTLEQMDLIHRIIKKHSNIFMFAGSTSEIKEARRQGKIASLIGIEGGHSIENSIEKLRDIYKKGARYMTLTHWKNLTWVESATDVPMQAGLSPYGEQVVAEMNRLGMLVDISHVSAKAMRHAIRVSKAPVIASHSSAYALKKHVRNVPDDVLKSVASTGGVVMVNFYSGFIGNEMKPFPKNLLGAHVHECEREDFDLWKNLGVVPNATLGDVVNHIEHIIEVAGIDHVGLGSDFDGVDLLPEGLTDVSKYPAITEELLRRGHAEEDVKKILGENLMRAFERVEEVARLLRDHV